jgi:hypothetical protein
MLCCISNYIYPPLTAEQSSTQDCPLSELKETIRKEFHYQKHNNVQRETRRQDHNQEEFNIQNTELNNEK